MENIEKENLVKKLEKEATKDLPSAKFKSVDDYLNCCKPIRKKLEEDAIFEIQRWKDPNSPYGLRPWVIKNLKNSEFTVLNPGDTVEIITFGDSFDKDGNFLHTQKCAVINTFDNRYLKLKLPKEMDNTYLASEGTKVFSFYKPLTGEVSYRKSNIIIISLLLLISILLGLMGIHLS